jgi:hypothetical protein
VREGLSDALIEQAHAEQESERAQEYSEKIRECTHEAVDELEYHLCVATEEVTRWTDYTYQVMQFICEKSKQEVSFDDIHKCFPYLGTRTDNHLPKDDEDYLNEPDSWS